MGTDGKCPRCAYKAPILCFYNEAKDGRILEAYTKLPPAVQAHYFSYLSLFRPASGTAMQSAKAARLTVSLADEIAKGYISRKGLVDRPAAPHIWSQAMEKMMEQAATLTLPLKTHGYLKTIVYDLANKENSGQEQAQRAGEARCQSGGRSMNPDVEKARRLADEKFEKEMEEWKAQNKTKITKLAGNVNLKGME